MINKKEYQEFLNDEIVKWEKRVYFPQLKFKENTPADLDLLKSKISEYTLKDKMMIISSETHGCVYKIARFMIECGVKNDKFTFIDGDIFLPYVDSDAKFKWKSKQMIDEIIAAIGDSIKRKWVIIPEFNIEWDKELTLYFLMKIKRHDCYGFLFYSNRNVLGNFAQILVEETYVDVMQFPKEIYEPKKNKHIEEDEY